MAFAYVASARSDDSYGTGVACNKPTGTVDNDIMLAVTNSYDAYPNTIPSGWTKIGELNPTGSYRTRLYWKKASSEGSTYTWGYSPSQTNSVIIATFRDGINLTNPIDVVSATAYVTNDTTCRAASMTVTSSGSGLVFIGSSIAGTTFTKPSVPTTDWTENYDGAGSDFANEICSMIWTSSGATGNMDATLSTSRTIKHAFAVAFNPIASGPANLKTYNTNTKANIKTINTNTIANVKTLNTNA